MVCLPQPLFVCAVRLSLMIVVIGLLAYVGHLAISTELADRNVRLLFTIGIVVAGFFISRTGTKAITRNQRMSSE